MITGGIIMWSGAIVDIPAGYVLCDGNFGTPDLRDKFIVGAGSTYNPGDNGGAVNHTHTFNTPPHFHSLTGGPHVQAGTGVLNQTAATSVNGTTNSTDNRPPYYALCYIMKT